MNKYDITGQKFGRWTVLEKDLNYRKEHNLKTKKHIGNANVNAGQ